jgi:hypothetical protein
MHSLSTTCNPLRNIRHCVMTPKLEIARQEGRLHVDQTLVHRVFSLISKTGANKMEGNPAGCLSLPRVSSVSEPSPRELGDGQELMGTSLQYAATQQAANYAFTMAAQLWKRTAYWVQQEMHEIVREYNDLVPAHGKTISNKTGRRKNRSDRSA